MINIARQVAPRSAVNRPVLIELEQVLAAFPISLFGGDQAASKLDNRLPGGNRLHSK